MAQLDSLNKRKLSLQRAAAFNSMSSGSILIYFVFKIIRSELAKAISI
jgi:hypothetical protein